MSKIQGLRSSDGSMILEFILSSLLITVFFGALAFLLNEMEADKVHLKMPGLEVSDPRAQRQR